MSDMNEFKLPEPVDGNDYYIDRLIRNTVTIDVCVSSLYELESDVDVCSLAVEQFRAGRIDGDATVVHTEKIRDIELDFVTDEPFDRAAWVAAKLLELGVRADGTPLRPGERVRPSDEMSLADFAGRMSWWQRLVGWAAPIAMHTWRYRMNASEPKGLDSIA